MLLFDRAYMTSYLRSMVTLAISCVVSEIFNVKNIATLKSRSRSIKVIESGTIRDTVCDLLLLLYCNFVPKTRRFF